MCGFSGFIGPGDATDIVAMTRALAHRGPDDEGFVMLEDGAIYLGHRRLSIIDVETGAQPMWDSERKICVIYNGEIYNHLALRRELEALGLRFHTDHCDTEVVVQGYKMWGDAMLGRLNGMFAFAVLDLARRRILLARDRFGEKPLYYASQRGLFAFSSELRALTKHRFFEREIDRKAVRKLFAYGYIPAPVAIYRDCYKLQPGHKLVFGLDDGARRIEPYWRFELSPDPSVGLASESELAEELSGHLRNAVQRRLMSDRPLGMFLSGGIDSSAILANMTALQGRSGVDAFTIGFSEPSFDETSEAAAAARSFGVRHHVRRIETPEAEALIPDVLSRLDEPFADPSVVPTFLLSSFAKEKVSVALTGDGGDELFAGYDPFRALAIAGWYERLVPAPLHALMREFARLLPQSDRYMNLGFKIQRGLRGISYPWSMRNPVWMAPLEPDELSELLDEPSDPEELYEEAIQVWQATRGNLVDRTLTFFTRLYLTDNILFKSDRASMMASLETRSIFLDNDIVDFCCRVPSHLKYRNGTRKYILKKALERTLPASILTRNKKGFGVPVRSWLCHLEPDMLRREAPLLRHGMCEKWLALYKERRHDYGQALWTCLSYGQTVMAH